MRKAGHLIPLLAILSLGGCDPFKFPDYRGQALLVVDGVVESSLDAAPAANEVVVAWLVPRADEADRIVREHVLVEGAFPATFQLSIFEPPPDEALIPAEETALAVPVAYGAILVLRPGADPNLLTEADIVGAATEHLLLFFAGEPLLPADYGLAGAHEGLQLWSSGSEEEISAYAEAATVFGGCVYDGVDAACIGCYDDDVPCEDGCQTCETLDSQTDTDECLVALGLSCPERPVPPSRIASQDEVVPVVIGDISSAPALGVLRQALENPELGEGEGE